MVLTGFKVPSRQSFFRDRGKAGKLLDIFACILVGIRYIGLFSKTTDVFSKA
jgi:hypothetical protein